MEDKKKIDELFGRTLGDFEAEPPADAWNAIENRLAIQERKKRMAYWRWAGMAAALVLAFFSGYFFRLENPANNQGQPAQNPVTQGTPSKGRTLAPEEKVESGSVAEEEKPLNQNLASGEFKSSARQKGPSVSGSKSKTPNARTGEEKAEDLGQAIAAETTLTYDEPEKLTLPIYEAEPDFVTEEFPSADLILPEKEKAMADPLSNKNARMAQNGRMTPEAFIAKNEEQASSSATHEKPDTARSLAMVHSKNLSDPRSLELKTNDELQNKKKLVRNEGFGVALSASPTFAFRNVNIKSDDSFVSENVANEELTNSYAAALDVTYRPDSRLEWQVGVHHNQWLQSSHNTILEVTPPVNSSTTNTGTQGFVNTSSGSFTLINSTVSSDVAKFNTDKSENAYVLVPVIEQHYQFIEIPVSLGYYLLESRHWGWKIRAGLSPRFLSGEQVNLVYPDGSSKDINELQLNEFSLQLLAATGVEYRFSSHFHLSFSPSLQYGITPINQQPKIDTYFHQFLIFSGLGYRF